MRSFSLGNPATSMPEGAISPIVYPDTSVPSPTPAAQPGPIVYPHPTTTEGAAAPSPTNSSTDVKGKAQLPGHFLGVIIDMFHCKP